MMKIHEFDPQIYPCKLWVAITTECKTLSERFEWKYNGSDIDIDFDNTDAITGLVREKNGGRVGVLIVFQSRKVCTISNICHEASHAVDDIWQRIGEKNVGHEANAYLAGWISGCIEKTIKFKNNEK